MSLTRALSEEEENLIGGTSRAREEGKERCLGKSSCPEFCSKEKIGTEWIADSITYKDDVYFLSKQT